jgi:hypothetical protein
MNTAIGQATLDAVVAANVALNEVMNRTVHRPVWDAVYNLLRAFTEAAKTPTISGAYRISDLFDALAEFDGSTKLDTHVRIAVSNAVAESYKAMLLLGGEAVRAERAMNGGDLEH